MYPAVGSPVAVSGRHRRLSPASPHLYGRRHPQHGGSHVPPQGEQLGGHEQLTPRGGGGGGGTVNNLN